MDALNFHAAVAATNATFLTAKAADLTAIKSDLASHNVTQLATDRQKLHDDIVAHTLGLKTDVATWRTARVADITALHADIAVLRHARAGLH
jgi:hypothetical protein